MIKSRAKLLNFCLLCLLILSIKTKAQTTVTIGDINTTYYSERYPFNGFYNYSWSNMLYLNSEVGSAGQITQVSFYVMNAPASYTMNNQKIYVRNTTATSFTNANYPGNTGFTQVYNGTIIYNGAGWKTITLSTPFSYDGTSNLEFLFENQDATWANGFPYFAYTTSTGSNRMRRDYQDASFPSSCANCLALNSILNIQLTKQCANSMTLTASSASVCSGISTTLTASGASTYTWLPTTALNTSNSASVISTPSASIIYTVTGKDASNCSQTNTLSITVLALPNLTVTPTTPSVCIGGSITLIAAGASNYTWSPATGLNASNTASVIANPTVTTVYTITGSGSNNCFNTKTTSLTVYSNPVVSVTPSSTTICNGGITNLVASGASTYSWIPSNGLNATNSSSVNANPGTTTIYTITGSNSGCNGSVTATVLVSNVNVGTAIATGSGNICSNNQVSLSLDSKQAIAIGTGTLNIEKYPFNGYYNYSWSDAIYTQNDIGANGSISKISFYVDNAPSNYTMLNQLIYIRSTSATSFTDNVYPGTSGFTQVYNGSITYNGSGLKEVTFTTPYYYNGTDNLEILFENRDGSYAAGFPLFRFSYVSSTRVKRDYLDANFPSTCTNCGAFANIPNVSFTIDRTLSTFVKWQSSYDNTTYTDLSGATTQNYATQAKTSTYYRAQLTNGSCNAYSSPTFYVTNNNYYVNDNSTTGDIYTSAIGSSTNTGKSPLSPKASINDILTSYTLSICDTIFVDKGTYTEEVNITSLNVGNGQGYVVITGAGIDVSILNAPTSKNNILLNLSSYFKIERFTLNSTQSTFNNVNIQQATNNVIANNKLVHSTSTNINLAGTTVNSRRNEFSNNQINNSSTSGYGITVIGNSDSVIIRGNAITMSNTNSLSGIVITSTKIGSNIYYPAFGAVDQNTISAQNYGVILYGSDFPISSYTVSNNNITIANKTLTDGSTIWLGSVGNTSADKSLIYNNRLNGGKNGIYLSGGVNYEKIYNNYISNSDNGLYVSSSTSAIGELYFNSFYNTTSNLYFVASASAYWKIKNNILYNSNNTASNTCIKVANAMTFLACNNNLYYTPNGASVGSYNGVNYPILSNWKAIDHADETTNGDENSVYGNPLFVNASQNNLDIISSSPAATSGTVISGITQDIYNLTRLTPPFIGAHELLYSLTLCNTQTITCAVTIATLTGTTLANGVTYSWVGPNSGTPAGSSPSASLTVVSAAGVYTLTITNSVNQSISSTVQVIANNTVPNINAGPTRTISTTTPTVTLSGSSITSGVTYSWTPGGTTPTSNTTSVTSGGIYTLTVTDSINSCVNSATVLVAVKLSVSANITDYLNDSLKGIANLTITGGTPPYKIAWNGIKIPSISTIISYLTLADPTIVIDTIKIKSIIASLSSVTVYPDLPPGSYSLKIYDNLNDSIDAFVVVGSKINRFSNKGVTISTIPIMQKYFNNTIYFYGSGEEITQSGDFTPGNSVFLASNNLGNDFNNYVEFVNPDVNKVSNICILKKDSIALTDALGKTYFEFDGFGHVNIHFLDSVIYSGNASSGDSFSISNDITTDKLFFYKNSISLVDRQFSRLNPEDGLVLKVVMGSSGAKISGLVMRTSATTSTNKVIATITDVTCGNPNSGIIDSKGILAGALANFPIRYELFEVTNTGNVLLNTIIGPFTNNHALFQNLNAGKYEVVYYALGLYSSGSWFPSFIPVNCSTQFEVAYLPEWTNNQNVLINPTDKSLTKNIGATQFFTWNAGASSINILKASKDGWIEWTSTTGGVNGIGFSDVDVDRNINTIDYGIGLIEFFNYYIVTNNQLIMSAMLSPTFISGNYPANSIFRLEKNRITNTITFKIVNGATLATFPISSQDLILDASLQVLNTTIKHPRVSFGCYTPDYFAELKKEYDGGYHVAKYGTLKFKYSEEYNTDNLNFKIYNFKRQIVTTIPSILTKNEGDNRYSINFLGTIPSGLYYLEVLNGKGEKMVLKFKL